LPAFFELYQIFAFSIISLLLFAIQAVIFELCMKLFRSFLVFDMAMKEEVSRVRKYKSKQQE
jgi:hypothetical protein